MIVESYEDVIILSGALRSNFWETLHTAISLTLKRHPSGVIIDCGNLTEATPEGGETFRDVMEFIRRQDARVIVASLPENIREVLKSVPEVRSQLAIADSVAEARHSLDLLVEQKPGKRKQTPPSLSKIVVCLTGEPVDRETLRVAEQLGEAREAELHLVYVVLVPRDLPLTAPLPKEEGLAAGAIERGKEVLDRHLAVVPHIERGRDVATTLDAFVRLNKASLVVMSLGGRPGDVDGGAALIRSILAKLDQEIIFVRPQGSRNGSHS